MTHGKHSVESQGREAKRLATAKERVTQVSRLDIHIVKRAHLVATACLALLDYMNPPDMRCVIRVRAFVRKALSMLIGAPEVVFWATIPSPLHPMTRAAMSLFRLWTVTSQLPNASEVLNHHWLYRSGGRLGLAITTAMRMGWILTARTIEHPTEVGMQSITLAHGWSAIRARVLTAIRDANMKKTPGSSAIEVCRILQGCLEKNP